MISNNHPLLSQKLNTINMRNNLRNFVSKPNKIQKQTMFQARIRQSQDNLFNFIKDSFI